MKVAVRLKLNILFQTYGQWKELKHPLSCRHSAQCLFSTIVLVQWGFSNNLIEGFGKSYIKGVTWHSNQKDFGVWKNKSFLTATVLTDKKKSNITYHSCPAVWSLRLKLQLSPCLAHTARCVGAAPLNWARLSLEVWGLGFGVSTAHSASSQHWDTCGSWQSELESAQQVWNCSF